MTQYWVVGAMWDGHDDQYSKFVEGRYWQLGWVDDEQPAQEKGRA